MGGEGIDDGHVEVLLDARGILVRNVRGFVRHGTLLAAHRECDALLDRHADVHLLLTDTLAIEGFESGVPMSSFRWLIAHRAQWHRAAMVTRSRSVAAVSSMFTRMLPGVLHRIFSDRDAAVAFLLAPTVNTTPKRRAQPPP